MSKLIQAIQLAIELHEGQLDKSGKPFINHPLRVMNQMPTREHAIVAVLHDTVEDKRITWENLAAYKFSSAVMGALYTMTRRKDEGEMYADYLYRVRRNVMARVVKIADIRDNLDLTRYDNLKKAEISMEERYFKALEYLTMQGEYTPSINFKED